MAIYDLDKTGAPPALLMRRGDKGTEYTFSVANGDVPFDLTGYTVALEATLRDGTVYDGECEVVDAKAGKVKYTSEANLTAVEGEVYPSYLALTQGSNRFTSTDLHIFIFPDTDLGSGEYAKLKNRLEEINEEWEAIKKQVQSVKVADGSITIAKLSANVWATVTEVDQIFGG